MGKGHIHLIVPGLINGSEMFGKLFYKRNKDQTDEGVGNTTLIDDEGDLLYQADGDDSDQGYGNSKGENALSEGQFVLLHLFAAVRVLVFIGFEDGVVDTFMGSHLKEDIDGVRDNEEDGCDA